MQTLGFTSPDGIYSNIALLLSDQCNSSIKAATFAGTDKSNFQDRWEFSGSLFRQMDEMYAYLDMRNQTTANRILKRMVKEGLIYQDGSGRNTKYRKYSFMELQQELVKKANNKEAYDEIADEIFELREKRQQASMDTVQRDKQL